MNLDEYEKTEFSKYERFSVVVAHILRAALKNETGEFHLWEVQHRAKKPDSLRKKLTSRGIVDHQNIENEVKDLSGCRLIFYSNDDVDWFLASGIVSQNFDVDWDKSKIHQPTAETGDATELYRAHHYLVSLKPERAKLPEYAPFASLKSEIQVQTILNHAWSETGHDVIYKPPNLNGFGARQHKEIKERMAKIMREHLLPAGYDFQKVLHDFRRLSQGRELFDRNIGEEIKDAADNNVRYDLLERYRDYVVPNYDDLRGVYQDVLQVAADAIIRSRETETKPISTPLADFEGKDVDDIADVALDVIDYVRYIDVQATFSKLCEIFLSAHSDKERDRIIESVRKLAENNLTIWQRSGPAVQSLLTQQLTGFASDQLRSFKPLVIEICKDALSSDVTGTSSTYKTVTWHSGSVVPSEELRLTRQRAMEALQRVFLLEEDAQKHVVISAFNNAFRQPSQARHSDELLLQILSDAKSIFEFYLGQAGQLQYEVLQRIEHDALFTYRRTLQWIDKLKDTREIVSAGQELVKVILTFRDHINSNEKYLRYKTLVGFKSVFPPEWGNDEFGHQEKEAYRTENIAQFVDEINEETAKEWFQFIRRCAQTRSDDLATFPKFAEFLRLLSERKPDIALSLLKELDEDTGSFLPAILGGLWNSNKKDEAQEYVDKCVQTGSHLVAIAMLYRNADAASSSELKAVLDSAIENAESLALLTVLEACFTQFEKNETAGIVGVFLAAIEELTKHEDARWAKSFWLRSEQNKLLAALEKEQVALVLKNLLYVPQVEYQVEELLTEIAKTQPELVIRYFGDRLQYERDHRRD